jgi:DNA polymerase III epsilon subunit-like protein
MGHILIFDTETSGLPPYKMINNKRSIACPEKYASYWVDCRLIELGWLLYTSEGTLIKSSSSIIKPDIDFLIPIEAARIHGITTEKARKEGRNIQEVLKEFIQDLELSDLIIAHNMDFDYNIILSELIRFNYPKDVITSKKRICTMKDYLKPTQKWPKLSELYYQSFGKPMFQSHRALEDAQACADIYFHIQGRT